MPPFIPVFEDLSEQGHDLERVLWVLPRTENAAAFKADWARFHAKEVTLAPHIQTADRISKSVSEARWFDLKAKVVQVLDGAPTLVQTLSDEQKWTLAQEYLELAFRLVLLNANNPPALNQYIESNRFAEMEAQVVLHLAQIFADDLRQLIVKPNALWNAQTIDRIVWFNDGEMTPKFWFDAWFPGVFVENKLLTQIEGDQPWLKIAKRFESGQCPVSLSLAPDETTQSRQVVAQVLAWLKTDSEKPVLIAVVDRLAARRVVAELDEHRVKVDDRTGWRLSTSSVAGWLHRLLIDFDQANEIGSIAHPFESTRIALAQPLVLPHQLSLPQWACWLLQVLRTTEVVDALNSDEAGRLILQGLKQMSASTDDRALSLALFIAAWSHWAESVRFKPLDVKSPVRVLPILTTRLNESERVIVLGCSQSAFQESPPGLLPPSVAHELGLPGPKLGRIQKISALYDLLLSSEELVFMHAETADGRPQTLLPELLWLNILVQQKSAQAPFVQRHQDFNLVLETRELEPLQVAALPQGGSVPKVIRVSSLDEWVACPLRFGLTRCLPWSDNREMAEQSFEQLRGSFVHKVIEKSTRHMRDSGADHGDLSIWKHTLAEQAQAVWLNLTQSEQMTLYPFLRFFDEILPRVAGKLIERFIDGWQFVEAEKKLEGVVNFKQAGQSSRLIGRADRVDQRAGKLGLVDIKFTRAELLKKRAAEPLLAPQLPAYEALIKQPVGELAFLALHKDSVEWVPFPSLEDYRAKPEAMPTSGNSWGEALMIQLEQDLDDFFAGKENWQAIPDTQSCQWCAAYGVCRPGDLSEEVQEEPGDE